MNLGDVTNQGASLGASKAFLKNKLMVSSINSWVRSTMTEAKSTILNLGGNVIYTPVKGHRVNFRISSLNNNTIREGIEESPEIFRTDR
ncbi:MAG: hypothetical protein LRY55_13125 [Leadbetterella sp.]|nr:hypothetical protein [Leadbetterella sp.]